MRIGTTENNIRHPFVNKRQLFSLSSIGFCKVAVVLENFSLAFSIKWNIRNHFDGVFKEYLSDVRWYVCFRKIMISVFDELRKAQNAGASATPLLQS